MNALELILVLLVVAAALAVVAERLKIPYPILLVLGGLGLAFVPGLPAVKIDPELVLLLFLPPLLYAAAWFTSWRDFAANSRPITLLAVGLVVVTTTAVAWIAHAVIPGMSWSVAFVLGAIVSPPDAVAATGVTQRLKVPRRIVTILEGESLVNDATGLVAYRFALAAVATGTFSFTHAAGRVALVAAGGVAVGLAVGWLVAQIHRRMEDFELETVITLLTPYAAYIPAEHLGVSGVLATVAAGGYLGWRNPQLLSALTRFRGQGARLVSRKLRERDPNPPWQAVALIGWTGMRGIVSLALALALPLALPNGNPFPQRAVVVVVSFAVILATLVVQGLTLPAVIKALKLKDDGADLREEREALRQASEAAVKRLTEIDDISIINPQLMERVRLPYAQRLERLTEQTREDPECRLTEGESAAFRRLRGEALDAERKAIVALRNQGRISEEVLHRVQEALDLEALQPDR